MLFPVLGQTDLLAFGEEGEPQQQGGQGLQLRSEPLPLPCLSFPQLHRIGALWCHWTRGAVGLGVTWDTAVADALPFKGKLGSCLAGGFLARVWHWVVWLQQALIAGGKQKRKRKAEKLLWSEDCKGHTSARAGTAGAFCLESG